MGVFGDLMESSKRSYLIDNQARLSSLLADKAAGKNVSQSAIRSAMFDVETTQDWLSRYDQQRQQQAYADENVKQDYRRSREAREEAFREKRTAQREADFQARQNYVDEVMDAATTFKEAMEELAFTLQGILLDDESLTLDQASRLFLRSFLGITAEDAQLLGSDFLATYMWIMKAEDSEGQFITSEVTSKLNPDDFDTDFLYRIEVAAEMGKELLNAALKPWSQSDLERLSIKYYENSGSKSSYEVAGRAIYCVPDKRRGQILLQEFDEINWSLVKWVTLPLPKDFDSIEGYAYAGRNSFEFTFNQIGDHVFGFGTLYKIGLEGRATKLVFLDITRMNILGESLEYKIDSNNYGIVPQQLISINDSHILVCSIKAAVSKRCSCVAIDLLEGKVLWKLREDSVIMPEVGHWQYHTEKQTFIFIERFEVQQPIIKLPPRSFLKRIFSGPQAEATQKSERALRIVELEALTGKILTRLDVNDIGPDKIDYYYSNDRYLLDGNQLHIINHINDKEEIHKAGTLNLLTKTFHKIPPSKPVLSGARLGTCRLHAIIQLIKHRGLCIDNKGERIRPSSKLISKY